MSGALTINVGDRGAGISACGQYRYSLWRRWDPALPSVLWVMLNPSTADADVDDQTIRKCMGFAQRWGAGGITVVNLYAWRATDPRELASARGPVGEYGPFALGCGPANRNDIVIAEAVGQADRVICAWGSQPGPIPHRAAAVLPTLLRRRTEALRLTKHGHPWHPLYVPYSVQPIPYPAS